MQQIYWQCDKMNKFILVLIMNRAILTLLIAACWHASSGTALPDTTIKGIPVGFIYSEDIFPDSWLVSPISGKGESLGYEEFHRSGRIISKALQKYPVSVLRENLHAVYILKSMHFYDVGYGGTNSTAEVYITNNGELMGYTDAYIEQTFHHEFSSILYRNHPEYFDEKTWLMANEKNFDYNDPENGVGAIRKNESSQDLDTALCRQGFLTQYALSGLENDINTVAQNLFRPSEGFWKIVDSYPSIRTKVTVLIAFYHRFNNYFTESYFRKLSR
jgi:hypothetical protein